ncbi:carcinoembryonic antigen-related cell adhesion molecule 8-like [Erinaceus europaeus]|uniref:Carcinoembryonic antigen-related cell adhesion molecule 8-like n=1 Tax=Erinaceus europaeus TaxID=9365 RepID=A0ABM3WZP6_ERIEU|nr:carcinoembryonic antigen-related cell adhesion molecule 8-like [Erinaceus europaeus]
MEPSSAPIHRGRVHWQGLLLAVLLLTIWMPNYTTQLIFQVAPKAPNVGGGVLLYVNNISTDASVYFWYMGESIYSRKLILAHSYRKKRTYYGPAYSSRMELLDNGSLGILNLTAKDTGYFTFRVMKRHYQTEELTRHVRVYYVPLQKDPGPTRKGPGHSLSDLYRLSEVLGGYKISQEVA